MAKFQCNMISYVLNRAVDMTVIIPTVTIPESMGMTGKEPSHRITEKYPVLYLLHGMGNNHATWNGYSNVELFAEEQQLAVVMISGENKAYKKAPDGDDFFRFVAEEVPEFVTNMFPISDEPAHSYIAGLSMGGYGAMLHGLSAPERFAAIGSFSGAVMGMAEPGESPKDTPEYPPYLYKKCIQEGRKLPPIYLACGEDDFLYEMNKEFLGLLEENKTDVTWVSLPGYGHEWRFWNMQVEEFMKWIPRTDGYADKETRKV